MFAKPHGIEFHDRATGRDMILVTEPGPLFNWLCYRYGNNEWTIYRRATHDDLQALGLNKPLSEHMNNDGYFKEARHIKNMDPMLKFNKIIEEAVAAGKITTDEVGAASDAMVASAIEARRAQGDEYDQMKQLIEDPTLTFPDRRPGDGGEDRAAHMQDAFRKAVEEMGNQGIDSFTASRPCCGPLWEDIRNGLAGGSIAALLLTLFDRKPQPRATDRHCRESDRPRRGDFIRIGAGIFRRENVEAAIWDESEGTVKVAMRQPWNADSPIATFHPDYDTREFPPKPENIEQEEYDQAISRARASGLNESIEASLRSRRPQKEPSALDALLMELQPLVVQFVQQFLASGQEAGDESGGDDEFSIENLNIGDSVSYFDTARQERVTGVVDAVFDDDQDNNPWVSILAGDRIVGVPFEFVSPVPTEIIGDYDDDDEPVTRINPEFNQENGDAPGTPE